MKTTKDFLSYLRNQDINIWVEEERLCVNAPEGVLTPELRTQLATRKAEILAFLRQLPSQPAIEPIQPVPRNGGLLLSFAQERIWFLSQLEEQSVAYNVSVALRLTGSLHIEMLERSFNEIIRRHEVLRTTFITVGGKPVQVIAPTLDIRIPITDLRQRSKREKEAEVQRLAFEEARCPFDLAQGPLFRAALLHLDEEEYVILATFHHSIFDGWSTAVFVRELVALYEAFSTGKASTLPELPIQYADFAHWQREWLQGEMLKQQLSYWKQQLSGDLPVLELPTDHPRPARLTFRGATQSFVLPETLSKAIKTLSRQEGVTLFTTLLTAFNILLHRYTGQEDILVGSPIANRNRAEIENLIGFFVNTLVLRTDLSGNPTVRELLGRVNEATLGSHIHQDLPFEHLVAETRTRRELSHHPLFQVMFVFQNTPTQELKLPGLTLTPIELHNKTAKFDLTLDMRETDQGLSGLWEYNIDLFENTTITRMIGHFQTLLEGMTANPEQQLLDLPILTEAERHQILVEWNDTKKVDYPKDTCLHELFEAQVERTPDATALVFEDQKLSYQELNQRANQLAHYLRTLGVGPEILVGICVERSLEMVVGLLGVLKAGGAYVPLDPEYPKERLAFMIEDSQTSVLLTQEKLKLEIGNRKLNNGNIVCLDSDWETITQECENNPVSGVNADNLIYVIYTSGSTGKPKGAMNIHRALCNRLLWMQDAYRLTADDHILQKTPFSFDVSGWEFFWPLITGARLVIAKPGGHKDSAYLIKLITDQKITTMHFVPPMLQVFLQEPDVEQCTSLRQVICSGEALPYELQQCFFERLGAELHNLYGPTEAAIDVTFWHCKRENQRKIVPIGRPIANTQIYILDRYLQPVPIGASGELYIGGVGLARGYLNRPGLTKEKFIPGPFSDEVGARLYRTGDLARFLPDGNIEFLGRVDHQVKIRGFRIELGEIEAILAKHAAVREVVVIAREDQPGNKRLVAYVVSSDPAKAATTNELRSFLMQKLPEYMIPSAFITLETLPLSPSGKVDRRALPAPEGLRPKLEAAYVMPQSETERFITQIWQQVLQVDKIGIHDNFFDLGGHSLLAAQIHSKLQEKFDREFSLIDLFQYPTIQTLAQYLNPEQQEKSVSESGHDRAKRHLVREASMKQQRQLRQRRRTAKKRKGEGDE